MPMHYATSTALHQLNRWVRTGKRPPVTPRFEFAGSELAKDEHGNTLGGIRMPPVEVPVARYESTTCNLGGITVPFTDAQIQALYPTFDRYQGLMKARDRPGGAQGWLLPPDAVDQMRRVCTVQSRYPEADRGTCRPTRRPSSRAAPGSRQKLRLLHPRPGRAGPRRTVPSWCEHLAECGVVVVVSPDRLGLRAVTVRVGRSSGESFVRVGHRRCRSARRNQGEAAVPASLTARCFGSPMRSAWRPK